MTDVHALGLQTAQGLTLTTAFYWDLNDKTRAFAKRFAARNDGKYPTMVQAGVYSSVLHYLEAVAKTGSATDGAKVVAAMKSTHYDDPLFGDTVVRQDGRAVHAMYLVEVKKPSESKRPVSITSRSSRRSRRIRRSARLPRRRAHAAWCRPHPERLQGK